MIALGKPPRCFMFKAGVFSKNLVDRWTASDMDAMAINFYPMALHTFQQLYGGVTCPLTLQGMQYHLTQSFRILESKHLM